MFLPAFAHRAEDRMRLDEVRIDPVVSLQSIYDCLTGKYYAD